MRDVNGNESDRRKRKIETVRKERIMRVASVILNFQIDMRKEIIMREKEQKIEKQ